MMSAYLTRSKMLTLQLFLITLLIVEIVHCETLVDLNGRGCDQPGSYLLKNSDEIITLYARDHRSAMATRDYCQVNVDALPGRRIEYVIELIRFSECGVEITIYDNPTQDTDPLHVIDCNYSGRRLQGKTRYSKLRLHLRKTVPESRFFEFQMRLKDDRGVPMDFIKKDIDYVGDAMDPGVIAGIGIAGAIVVVALILLAIYLCVRGRQNNMKDNQYGTEMGDSSVYRSENSQVIFPSGAPRYPKGRYGSMEDIRNVDSSQEKTNGAYTNPAYTKGPSEKGSERSASVGRARGKTGFSNDAFDRDSTDMGGEEKTGYLSRGGEGRTSRRDAFEEKKPMKSALKKRDPDQSVNGILKTRAHSPSRSHTSSTDTSVQLNALVHGYKEANIEHPNVHHKPVLERRRSRSGTRSNASRSSGGRSQSKRSQSADKKKPKDTGRMYSDVFFNEPRRSHSRSRTRSNSLRSKRSDRDRVSDSLDSQSSASSATSYSKKVSMNPGGKRVHIKGEETDI